MRCVVRLVGTLVVSGAVVVSLPAWAAAQHTITGRLVEQLPGGTPLPFPGVFYDRVAADGSTTYLGSITTCTGGETANCVRADGSFTLTGLAAGTYQLSIEDGITPVLDKVFSVNVTTDVDVGTVQLIRTPFKIDVIVGAVPATGGLIPVTVRVRTTWNIPTILIVAKIEERQSTTADGFTTSDVPRLVDFVWPSGFTDSGPVSLSPLRVAPDDPAGSFHCVHVTLLLQGNRKRTLGSTIECSGKRP